MGTMGDGSAAEPIFELNSTLLMPAVGEKVTIRALVEDGNTTNSVFLVS